MESFTTLTGLVAPLDRLNVNTDEIIPARFTKTIRRTGFEKALFARRLIQLGHSKDVAKASLSVDDTLLSRMLSITEIIPSDVVEGIGAARTVGRDRWEDLKKLFDGAKRVDRAREIAAVRLIGRGIVRLPIPHGKRRGAPPAAMKEPVARKTIAVRPRPDGR